MERILKLLVVGMIISAILFGFFAVVATDWGAMIGHRVLKEVVRFYTTVCGPVFVSPEPGVFKFKGIECRSVPGYYEDWDTVLLPKVADYRVMWILSAVFFGFFLLFTILFADALGVLGVRKIMTLLWILTALALVVFIGVGVFSANGVLLALAVALIPVVILGAIMSFTSWALKTAWTLSAIGIAVFIAMGLPFLSLVFIPLIVLGLVIARP